MIGVTVTGADRTADRLRGAGKGLAAAQVAGVRRAVVVVERGLKQEMTEQGATDPFWGKVGSPGDGLAVRTGRTRASVTGATYRVGDRVVGAVGSKAQHLKLHEDGGTTRGTSPRGYHRIPTAAAKTAAGVDRNAGRSIRAIPGAFLFTSKTGRLWAALNERGVLRLLYLLVQEVTQRPRRIFQRVRDRSTPAVVEAMRSEVALVVQRANA